MNHHILRKYLLLFSIYIFSPLVTLELFSQFKFSTGYIYNQLFEYNLLEFGFHTPNQNITNTILTIYPDYQEEKYIKFKTDDFGTIEPSSLSSNKYRISESIIFCGGSTTETSLVQEGRRVPDVFSSISKIPSVNLGKSGKNLGGCIKSIEFILSNIGMPKMIIVANNVNTLGEFAKLKSEPLIKKQLKLIFPGIYTSLKEIKKSLKKSTSNSSGKSDTYLPPYEFALQQGCCHIASEFNKTNNAQFDWDNDKNLEDYYNFVADQGKILKDMLTRYDYPWKNTIIFIEPNSFLNSKTSALYDYRQFLSNIEGKLLSGLESAKITKNYDLQYQLALKRIGFEIIEVDPKDLRNEYFYDAVHLSPEGAEFIGKFYANQLN